MERNDITGGTQASSGAPSQIQRESFDEFRGNEIEPFLRSGAVAILNAAWVVSLWRGGGRIRRRQELPPEAFLAVDELIAATKHGAGLALLVISYAWLHPENPDPNGAHLALIGKVCHAFIESRSGPLGGGSAYGVFWDFASLYQHAPGAPRSAEHEALFRSALSGMSTFYTHEFTVVLRLTRMPADYPHAYNLPEGANSAAYSERGWCFTESCWASLTKSSRKALDLGLLRGDEPAEREAILKVCTEVGGRPPPLLPDEFAAHVSRMSFTNGKDDRPLVIQLYREAFAKECGRVVRLNYGFLGWGDAEAEQLARVMASGALLQLQELNLSKNSIGEAGMQALAKAVASGRVPQLQEMDMDYNPGSADPVEAALSELYERHTATREARAGAQLAVDEHGSAS